MKKIIIIMCVLFPIIAFSQEKVSQSTLSIADKYLNISTFREAFKQNIGSMTGNRVGVVVNDSFNITHGAAMASIVEGVKISNDVRVIGRDINKPAADCKATDNKGRRVKCELSNDVENLLAKGDVRVWNESNGWPVSPKLRDSISYATITDQFKRLLKKYDVMYMVAAGNNNESFGARNVKTLLNNPFDNLFAVAQFGIDTETGKPVMQNGKFFRAPDFSVFGEYVVEDGKKAMTYSGTSNATAVASAIIAQYYSIMPCWSTMDMKRFIYATLQPAQNIGLKDLWTKTKKYLTYSEKIFDQKFLRANNIKVCKD
jgi:hypothetical protein